MKLSEIMRGIPYTASDDVSPDVEITGVSAHHEKVKAGNAFICIKGQHGDGHEHIDYALAKGAAVIVTDRGLPPGSKRYVHVPSARFSWAAMEHNAAGRPGDRLKLAAVTGTNGKSSVAEIFRSMAEAAGHKCGEVGTLTGDMTTPDPDVLYPALAGMAANGCDCAILEASSHALAYDKLAPLRFECGAFTNISLDHTDFHGGMEKYGKAKAKLFGLCRTALVNYDDPVLTALSAVKPENRYFFSMRSDAADFTARNIECSMRGLKFDFLEEGGLFRIKSPLIGRFQAANLLAAAGLARLFGFSPKSIKKGAESLAAINGRMTPVDTGTKEVRAFIDYAHTPDALRCACSSLRECMEPDARLILIFGCGGGRDKTKRPVMGSIAAELADFTIVTSDNSRDEDPYTIIGEILRGMSNLTPHVSIADRRQAIAYAVHSARPGDVLLFCGKGHEKYEIDAGGRHPFDEAEEIRRAASDRETWKK